MRHGQTLASSNYKMQAEGQEMMWAEGQEVMQAESLNEDCQELSKSRATPACIPTLLWSIFSRYSSQYSRTTPVHCQIGPDSTCLTFCGGPDSRPSLTWEVAVTHLSSMYLFSHHLYLLVPSLFSAHIYFDLSDFLPQSSLPHTGSG